MAAQGGQFAHTVKAPVPKRSMLLGGRRTSVSLEDPFWNAVKEIAASRKITPTALLTEINSTRRQTNFSSAIRLFVLDYYKSIATKRPENDEMPITDNPSGSSPQHTMGRPSSGGN